MKPRHLIMGMGLIVSAGLVIFGDKTPANQVVESVPHTATPNAAKSNQTLVAAMNGESNSAKNKSTNSYHEPKILELLPRTEIRQSYAIENSLFGSQSWTPPPPPPAPAPPPPPPVAPAVPYTYAGKRLVDGAWEVFLARGDNILYVHSSSVIETVYRIDSIAPPTLTMTYIPLNQRQTISIGDAE
jgi:hypothetical protein